MNFYWNLQDQEIVPSLNSRGVVSRYDFFLRDTLPIELFLCESQANVNQPYGVIPLESGQSINFGAKAAVTDEDFLFSAATWVSAGSGATRRYTADVSLNTAELIAAVGSAASLDVIAEFVIQNTSNEDLYTTQITFRIFPDIIKGTEGVPTSQYPVIAQYTDGNDVPSVRIVNAEGTAVALFKNGATYIFITETGLWYPITGSIVDGVAVPGLGAGENL